MNLSKNWFVSCHTFLIVLFGYVLAKDNPNSFLGKFYSLVPAQNRVDLSEISDEKVLKRRALTGTLYKTCLF